MGKTMRNILKTSIILLTILLIFLIYEGIKNRPALKEKETTDIVSPTISMDKVEYGNIYKYNYDVPNGYHFNGIRSLSLDIHQIVFSNGLDFLIISINNFNESINKTEIKKVSIND